MSASRTDPITTSTPRIIYFDTVIGAQASISLPAPQQWSVPLSTKKTSNEANSGATEHLVYFERDLIEISWNFLDEVTMALLRRLWKSTSDGTPFTFIRHQAMGDGWPNSSFDFRIHDNQWTVEWQPKVNEMDRRLFRGISRNYQVTLSMQEVKGN
jgi:hypothetical protein